MVRPPRLNVGPRKVLTGPPTVVGKIYSFIGGRVGKVDTAIYQQWDPKLRSHLYTR